MRLYKKRSLLQCIQTLKTANRQLRLTQYGQQGELLQQSQELALAVGGQIELSEGDNCITVRYLEEYCEILYRAFV